MRQYRYMHRASIEIVQIADYTNSTWGAEQALKYIDDLEALCHQLTLMPNMGMLAGNPNPDTRLIPFESHVVYYKVSDDFIDVLAVIHKNQLPNF